MRGIKGCILIDDPVLTQYSNVNRHVVSSLSLQTRELLDTTNPPYLSRILLPISLFDEDTYIPISGAA